MLGNLGPSNEGQLLDQGPYRPPWIFAGSSCAGSEERAFDLDANDEARKLSRDTCTGQLKSETRLENPTIY